MLDCGGRTVGIEHFKPIARHHHLLADSLEGPGSFQSEECTGLFIAVNPVSNKVICRVIADFLDDIWHIIGQQNES